MLKLPSLGDAPSRFSSLYFTEVLGSKEAGGRSNSVIEQVKGPLLECPIGAPGKWASTVQSTAQLIRLGPRRPQSKFILEAIRRLRDPIKSMRLSKVSALLLVFSAM